MSLSTCFSTSPSPRSNEKPLTNPRRNEAETRLQFQCNEVISRRCTFIRPNRAKLVIAPIITRGSVISDRCDYYKWGEIFSSFFLITMNRYPKKERCRVVERKLKKEGKANQTPLVSIISTEKREKEEKSLFLCRTETRRAGRSLCCPHFTLCPMRKRIIHILSSSFRRATNRDRREILNETRGEIEREKGREEGNERAKQTNGIRLDGGGQRWADRGGAGRGKWWICFTFHGGAIVPYYPA